MSQTFTATRSEKIMATHTDSKRTIVSHDKAVVRRISQHEKNLERYLADRAFKRLMVEVNGR